MGKPFPYIGIDGCPAGWFCVAIDDHGQYSFDILEHFAEIDRLLLTAALILVDIPIGLPSKDSPDRQCDKAARQMIKPRGSSVFPAPARSALSKKTYAECCEENFRVLGRKLSRQTWALARKIAEVDEHLRATRPGNIREMHPEVAFCGLNGGTPMAHSKKRTAGVNERLGVLSRHWAPAEDCFAEASKRFTRKQVGRDDIVDAIAGAVVASKGPGMATLPAEPLKDEKGLAMEIVYWPGGSQESSLNQNFPESDFALLLRAADFAADRHRDQRRKDADASLLQAAQSLTRILRRRWSEQQLDNIASFAIECA